MHKYYSRTDYPVDVVESTTEDFIQAFLNQYEFSGAFFKIMYTTHILPDAIDIENPVIKDILNRLDKWHEVTGDHVKTY